MLCITAGGDFVPPLFIFPRKKRCEAFMKNFSPKSIACFHSSGWIQMDIFTEWLKHFLKTIKSTKEDPVLLILDGQSHT